MQEHSKREWVRTAGAAVLGAAVVLLIDLGRARLNSAPLNPAPPSEPQRVPSAGSPSADHALDTAALTLTGSGAASTSGKQDANQKGRIASHLERVNAQLDTVQREKTELQREKRGLEAQLLDLQDEVTERDRYKYDLNRDEWKQLAAEGRVKFRMPCLMPLESSWKVAQPELDRLGLSPEEGDVLVDAQRRSNRRVWATLRPLCLETVGNPDVVDLLGGMSCLQLLEKVASRKDLAAVTEARRHVAEVHAGLRAAPEPGQPQHPVFSALLAISGEAQKFEADLAESFGSEDAKRIWQSMSCAATRD